MIRVLCVDDDPALLDLSRKYLERTGEFQVETVNSGAEALEWLAAGSSPVDVVVTDYQMPEMNGIELLSRIRENSRLPFILFTGRGREEVVIEALNSGVDFYIQKGGNPRVQFAELAHKCRQAVARYSAETALRESEEQYRALYESASDAIMVLRDMAIAQVNRRALALFDRTAEEMIGRSPAEFAPPRQPDGTPSPESAARRIQAALDGRPQSFDWLHLDRSGKEIYAEVSLDRITISGEPAVQAVVRDVTERHRNAEALRQSEEMYRVLVEHASEGVFIVQDGLFVYANQAIAEMIGTTVEGMLAMPFERVIAPEDRGRIPDYDRVRQEGEVVPGRFTLRLLHGDGASRSPVSISAARITYRGRPATMGLARSLAEEQQAEEFVRALLDAAPGVALLARPDGGLLVANGAALRSWGASEKELFGRSIFELMGPTVEAGRRQAVGEAVRTGRPVRYRDVRNGRSQDALITPLIGPGGAVEQVAIFSRDITEVQAGEAALRENSARVRALFEVSPDYIILIDAAGRILDMNGRAAAALGRPGEDLRGMYLGDFAQPGLREEREEYLARVLETGQAVRFEQGFAGRFYDYAFEPVPGSDGRVHEIAIFVRDVTLSRQAAEGLVLANRKLSLLSRITHHEIANQLTAARGRLMLLAEGDEGTRRSTVDGLMRSCEAIGRTLEFMAEYEAIGCLEPGWRMMADAVRSSADGFDSLDLHVSPLLETCEVYADPMIDRVFVNLFENACRYAGPMPGIRCTADEDADGLLIAVEDDGPGVPPDEKEQIFERGHGRNTGFGLFLSRECLAITGLAIEETGRVGHGARFEIRVPPGAYRLRARG